MADLECRIFYHDKCFDGACSASMFMRFHRECVKTADKFSFHGLVHRAGALFDENAFVAGENAIVDFKYSASPKVTWWFDHHQSAFLSPEDQKHFEATRTAKTMYDTSYKSCTSYIRDVARDKWGFTAPDLEDLVHWATIIDGAQYADPKTAVELGSPAMKLTLIIEGSRGSETVQHIIRLMQQMSLAEIVNLPEIQMVYQPLYKRHLKSLEIIREKSA